MPVNPRKRDGVTRRAIQEARASDPNLTTAELGRLTGTSKENVRQLLKALGMPTRTSRTHRRPWHKVA